MWSEVNSHVPLFSINNYYVGPTLIPLLSHDLTADFRYIMSGTCK